MLSKRLAEQEAWTLAKENGIGTKNPSQKKNKTKQKNKPSQKKKKKKKKLTRKTKKGQKFSLTFSLGTDLVTINPCLVVGPPASSRVDGTSVSGVKNLMEGRHRKNQLALVDVRDVARAHVLAIEKYEKKKIVFFLEKGENFNQFSNSPAANGRYMVTSTRFQQPKLRCPSHQECVPAVAY